MSTAENNLQRKWTKEKVARQLHDLHCRGEAVNPSALQRTRPDLAGAIWRVFRRHGDALRAAGIDPESARPRRPPPKWSRERVVERLKQLQGEGADLGPGGILKLDRSLSNAIYRRFGSHDDALRAAGIDPAPFRKSPKWARETVLDEVRRRHRDGEDLSSRHVNRAAPGLFAAMHRLFGSHRKTMEAAGIDPESVKRVRPIKPKSIKPPKIKPTTDLTREETLARLKAIEAGGRSLKSKALQERHRELWAAILVHFQDYAEALALAGISPRRVARPTNKRWDRESVVTRLKQLHARGADLCSSAIQDAHSDLAGAIHSKFGSHDAALKEAGIDPKSVRKQPGWVKWTRERIVKDLQRLHARGEPLTTSAIVNSHSRLYDGIRRQFGKVRAALLAAGIEPQLAPKWAGKWTFDKVLDGLLRRKAGGEDLSTAHVNRTAPALLGAAVRKFGSYRNALIAAGIDPESVSRRPKLSHWNEATVLQMLKEMHESGGDLRHRTMQEKHQPLFWAAKKLFGSYVNAVKQAGINYWDMSQAQLALSRIGKEQQGSPDPE